MTVLVLPKGLRPSQIAILEAIAARIASGPPAGEPSADLRELALSVIAALAVNIWRADMTLLSVPAGLSPEAVIFLDAIARERARQIAGEGFDTVHDDAHADRSLAAAAAAYAWVASLDPSGRTPDGHHRMAHHRALQRLWPRSWGWHWWRPKDARRDLVRAGALIVAELERLERLADELQRGIG